MLLHCFFSGVWSYFEQLKQQAFLIYDQLLVY